MSSQTLKANEIFNHNTMVKAALIFLLSVLLILAIGCGEEAENPEVTRLNTEKTRLMASIDSLQNLYSDMSTEADTLTAGIRKANATIEQKNEEYEALRKKLGKSNRETETLRNEVTQLQQAKAEYESLVNGMRNEIERLNRDNDALSQKTIELAGENEGLRFEIDEMKMLVRGMEAELDQRRIDGVKATNFRVEVLKSGDKPTGSNNRARAVVMDFDLNNIPQQLQGETQVYFVIKDGKTGVPIKSDNPIKATIKPKNGQTYSIIAQESKSVTLNENQRLEFRHELQTKLEKGYYRATAYSDLGLIGAVSFRLR